MSHFLSFFTFILFFVWVDHLLYIANIWRYFLTSFTFLQKPLAQVYHQLLEEGVALNLDLNDIWMREYQILPQRTHPLMRMNASSGYILSGIKVEPNPRRSSKRQKVYS